MSAEEDQRTHLKYLNETGDEMSYYQYLALRNFWRALGGTFYGPNVETGAMPESKLLPLLRHWSQPAKKVNDEMGSSMTINNFVRPVDRMTIDQIEAHINRWGGKSVKLLPDGTALVRQDTISPGILYCCDTQPPIIAEANSLVEKALQPFEGQPNTEATRAAIVGRLTDPPGPLFGVLDEDMTESARDILHRVATSPAAQRAFSEALPEEGETVKGETLFQPDDTEPGSMVFLGGQDGVQPPDIIIDTSNDPIPRNEVYDCEVAEWLIDLAKSLQTGKSPVHVRLEVDITTQTPVTIMVITMRPQPPSWQGSTPTPYHLFQPGHKQG